MQLRLSGPEPGNQVMAGSDVSRQQGNNLFLEQSLHSQVFISDIFFGRLRILHMASPQQGDLKLLGPQSGQGAGGGARTRDKDPCRSQGGLASHCATTPLFFWNPHFV
ncbi:hypothetical protein PoB_001436500 [Plakobranchus ocellatus]|uniref:Uncharacterized protein n=1 Tax=Plakobranchus ocellatus TaxID=259542 RepID=A0AAV3YXB9_9GAST|nr:hypothetical protein PoB_001436500 [Plakobranchus ocellatus]